MWYVLSSLGGEKTQTTQEAQLPNKIPHKATNQTKNTQTNPNHNKIRALSVA